MIKIPIYGTIKNMFQSTNQITDITVLRWAMELVN
jgi:hypothetical protein